MSSTGAKSHIYLCILSERYELNDLPALHCPLLGHNEMPRLLLPLVLTGMYNKVEQAKTCFVLRPALCLKLTSQSLLNIQQSEI